ncbi:MAG: serine/threonine-protein kinase [Pirellulales bacterium]
MSTIPKTAEQFAQRAFDLNLLDARQLESVWGELGSRNVPASEMERVLLRREFLTNYQIKRLMSGEQTGFFYGDYKVLYLVGTGTFARVFRAVHNDTGKVVALKVLRKRFSESPAETVAFLREGEMGAKLRHPNIVPIFEVFSKKRVHFLVMDFVEGRNLREFVRVRKKLPPLDAVKLITDITAGLSYAFEQGITHRDLKLSNVLVSSSGVAQLVDFGLAAISTRESETDMADHPNPRTIDYAALERATGVRKDDPRSDIYFNGGMLYHMLTGDPPLVETRDRLQRMSLSRFQTVVPIHKVDPTLPDHLVMVVNRAMELSPERRYQSPAEMLSDLYATARYLRTTSSGNGPGGGPAAAAEMIGTIMIVESDAEVQDMFRDKLKKRGYRVLVLSSPERARQRFDFEKHAADCIIFSCSGLGAEGVNGYNQFALDDTTKHIPALLILHPRQVAWAQKAHTDDKHVVCTMPIKLGEIDALVRKMLGREPSSSPST